jgi:hypothetical protein
MTRQAHIQRISGLSDEPVDIKFWSENGEDPDDKKKTITSSMVFPT